MNAGGKPAGSLTGTIITWKRKGFDILQNVRMGLIGALVGGLLLRLFGFCSRLDAIAISLRDVVTACAGSLLVLVVLWIWERSWRPGAGPS